MNLQTILNSKQAGRVALFLSRHIPPSVGYRLARFAAARIAANPETPMVQAIRANQWVVCGGNFTASQLDQAVLECLGCVSRSFFELFRYLNEPARLDEMVIFDSRAQELLQRGRQTERGVVACGLHMGNFDLVIRLAAHKGAHILGLSLPEANEAIEWQHALRRQVGVEILPASIANLRQLIRRLQAGEMVITGIDHPRPGLNYHPVFFGRPAQLPTHHIYLAQKARVPIVLLTSVLEDDGRYHVYTSDFIEMTVCGDHDLDMKQNAERVMQAAEALIALAPRQWTVFQPVWPQVLEEIPPPLSNGR
jgi:phosphatidylinositol dimannoside acyltransferase